MKNSADLRECYPPRPSASVDNTLLDLQNSSYPTQPHSVIAVADATVWSSFMYCLTSWQNSRCSLSTVWPLLLKRPPIKRPPSMKRPLPKVRVYLSVNSCIWYLYSTATSIKRPRPPFYCLKYIFSLYGFWPPLSGRRIIFPSIWRIILNKSSVKYLS